MAQATIYGRMDVSYGVKQATFGNGGLNWKQTGVMDGLATSNAIGFDATDDIGGGMKGRFVGEVGLSPTNASGMFGGMRASTAGAQLDGYAANSSDLYDMGTRGGYSQGSNRQTFVELSGDFGRVRAGYMRTLGYELASFDGHTATWEGAVGGQVAHVFGLGAAGGTRSNAIEYQLPKMGGWTVGLQMGSAAGRELTEFGGTGSNNLANGQQSASNTRQSLKIDWGQGPAKVGMVYTSFQSSISGAVQNYDANGDGTNDATASFNVFGALTSTTTIGNRTGKSTYTTNLTQLAGSYDFGMIKVGANINVGNQNITENASSGSGNTASAGSTVDIKSQGITFSMPMGAMVLAGGMGTASTSVAGAATKDQSTSQLSLRYNFSKRTAVYGLIGQAKDQTPINANSTSAVGYMTQTGLGMLTTF